MLGTFCRMVHSALLSAEIIPIDLEMCVVLECLVHIVDECILRCCRQKLFKSTKKCVLCARFSWHPTGISVPFCASWRSQIFCGRVRLECLVHFVDVYILRCCRQKLFQSTKKYVLCAKFSGSQREVQFLFVRLRAPKYFEDALG
ncbi:hypothetical protein GQR58_014032 [Nymphon striatum]|nr:hypothetical protein GQR58_014032 [Nymphon striatum]